MASFGPNKKAKSRLGITVSYKIVSIIGVIISITYKDYQLDGKMKSE